MRRLRNIAAHLTSTRGLLTIGALIALGAGVVVDPPLDAAFLIIAALLSSTVLFSLSYWVSVLHKRVSNLDQSMRNRPELKAVQDHKSPLAPVVNPGWPSPAITIVIPNYNDSSHVGEAIESVIGQSFQDWECVVVDDASTDDSLRVIWAAARGHDQIRFIRHRVNGGLSASRNTGLRLAKGHFVAFLDSDDLLMRKSLEDRIGALATVNDDPHVIGSHTGVAYRSDDVTFEELPTAMTWSDPERVVVDFITANGDCPFPAIAPLLRTDTLRSLGGFNESMRAGAEDWELWQRALRNGYVFVPSSLKTAVYRQRPGSMIRNSPDKHAQLGQALIEASHTEASPSIFTSPSPTPLPQTIGFYSKSLTQSRRAVRFGAMSYTQGEVAEASEALAPLHELPRALLMRHIDIGDEVLRGITRVGADHSRPPDEVADRVSEITDWVLGHSEKVMAVEPVPPPTWDLLMVPQHAAHLVEMLQLVAVSYPHSKVALLILERESGDQGVASLVPPAMPTYSLNEWSLSASTCDIALVGQVRSWIVEEVALGLSEQGTTIVEIADDYAALKALPEAPERTAADATDGDVNKPFQTSIVERWFREENPESLVDFDNIRDFKGLHRGERAVIIGNGPSLNLLDLTLLKSEVTFGVNGIFYAADQMGFAPTYYVVEDSAVVQDNLAAIQSYDAGHKLFPSVYRDDIGELENTSYFMMNRGFYAA